MSVDKAAQPEAVEKLVDARYQQFIQRHPSWHVSKAQRGDFWRQIAIQLQRELLAVAEPAPASPQVEAQGERCGVPMAITTGTGSLFCNAPKGHSGDCSHSGVCSHTFPWTVPSAPAPTATASSEGPAITRFNEFGDDSHPFQQWWKEHGQFMLSGGDRRESIWAARGWIAREQMACGVEVTGDSLHEHQDVQAEAASSEKPHDLAEKSASGDRDNRVHAPAPATLQQLARRMLRIHKVNAICFKLYFCDNFLGAMHSEASAEGQAHLISKQIARFALAMMNERDMGG